MCNTIGAGADNIGNFTTSESATTTNDGFYWTRNQTNGGTHARAIRFWSQGCTTSNIGQINYINARIIRAF